MKGIGIDLCSIARLEKAIGERESFRKRYFTEEERAYILSKGKMGAQSAAAMFAAKEAFLKALGAGIGRGITLQDVGVTHDAFGAPAYALVDAALEKLKEKGYLGKVQGETVVEQQLSGHSWLLRGLCEHYEQFHDEYCLKVLKDVTENLFLPTRGIYSEYPVNRDNADVGGVSGTELGLSGRWLLSTDVGCAFMSIDGLSHVYQITKDARVKELLDEMIGV